MSEREQPCRQHKPKNLGYVQWCNWAESMAKKGKKQVQCPKCKLWFFEEEMWWAYETGETLDNGTAVAWEVFFERGEPPYDGEIKVTDLLADAVLKALEVACEALATIECGLVTVGAAKYAGFKPKAIAFQSLEEIARMLEEHK